MFGGLILATVVTTSSTTAQIPTPTAGMATDATNSPTSVSGGDAAEQNDGVTQTEENFSDVGGGGITNMVTLRNYQDGKLRIRGNIDLNHIHGPRVEPRNMASAYASCTDCQTISVALQLALYERTAAYVAPENSAVAVNVGCTRCYTVARAMQYVLPVDDPDETPAEVAELIRQMDRELQQIHVNKSMSMAEAEARIDDVIARFATLAANLNQKRAATTESTNVTPTPVGTPEPTLLPVGSPTSGEPTETPTTVPADTSTSTPTVSPVPLP